MTVERVLRLMAGTLITLSLLLAAFVHPGFQWVAVFVGLNLLQSGLTNWCPMMPILRSLGVPDSPRPVRAEAH